MTSKPVIVWFDRDLRVRDNPSLVAAAETGRPVLPVYVLDDVTPGVWRLGGASRWWLHHSLDALRSSLAGLGLPLILRRGEASAAIDRMVADTGAEAVHWCRVYDPAERRRNGRIKHHLLAAGIAARSFGGSLLREPWEVQTGEGRPYRVFTPFWRALQGMGGPPPPTPAPKHLAPPAHLPASDALDSWDLLPRAPDWAGGLRATWEPGEAGARQRLGIFVDGGLRGYRAGRDRPDRDGTSMLSPFLHFGELSPRTVWHAVATAAAADPTLAGDAEAFLRELGWREFSHHLLYANDDLPDAPLRPEFAALPWRQAADELRAWQQGRTGFPIVDAGMRQLWHCGWMHNRVRMIAASFLVKDLLLPWQQGEAWFWDTLVDADLANNAASWQWVAGCGADAAPFFRVFNPVLQGEKFDPDGEYVRRYVPELASLPSRWIHRPWEAPESVRTAAGVRLGHDYPAPILDHAAARRRALAAFDAIKAHA